MNIEGILDYSIKDKVIISLFSFKMMNDLSHVEDISKLKADSDAGNPVAMAKYAWRMIHADGAPLDRPGGAKLALSSANKGCAEGQFTYGFCVFNGLGAEENQAEGVKYFKMAAEQNYGPALQQLGDCFMGGMGVEKNEAEAEKYYQRAKAAGFNPVAAC
ncbi:hypothetical protein TRFO_19756 [Tritrichomonas foetus]|uniref:Sel1 repeat family protein n=1 Tax=Tritrichomonas foetus TaxID=1144522 RepID=A0A1J4KN94_9EUKA|nr:hypothetical protein TRFO_19756 [Tritrichomonas foetus]|eukprot:OHT10861.1 hypothetical protein TRFO_19756 [Tritrichomonas foetus]